MQIRQILVLLGATTLIGSCTLQAESQKSTSITPPHGMPGHSRMGSFGTAAKAGNIVGNKNTKVYHLPGDKGAMPAEKNRVYFKTEREAMKAGYHLAGSKQGAKPHTLPMHGAKMGGHLPK